MEDWLGNKELYCERCSERTLHAVQDPHVPFGIPGLVKDCRCGNCGKIRNFYDLKNEFGEEVTCQNKRN